ncbi:MAG TPA: VOC family protein [Methylomirabilota bacterium]|nr:VOC family protein [Methylomirabilota bacterium]HEV8676969.1 VOC family protein [Methylomirabilota bacterium]
MSESPGRPLECLELDHVVLRVRDQAVSQRFYVEVLGLTLDHVNEPIKLVQLRCGRHLIDLLPLPPGEAPPASGRMDHVCLSIRCDDMAALAAYLRGQGVEVEGDVVSRRGAFGQGLSLYIRDPDGYRIELKPR